MDITMCKGNDCPVKEKCQRFTAKPDEYQSYFLEVPGSTVDNNFKCDYYWGENARNIWKQLNDIVKGHENKQ